MLSVVEGKISRGPLKEWLALLTRTSMGLWLVIIFAMVVSTSLLAVLRAIYRLPCRSILDTSSGAAFWVLTLMSTMISRYLNY